MLRPAAPLDPIRPEARDAPTSGIVDIMTYARGREGLIPLYVGEGDLPTPPFVLERARQGLADGETFYTYQRGIPELREAIARYHERVFGGRFDPDRFTVTVGGMHAAQMALRIVSGAGDEVLIPSPAWPNFDGVARVTGAVPIAVPLDCGPNGWTLDLGRLADAVTPRTRALLVNTPANPTGWTASREDLAGILEIARRHGLWIVADEIYGRFVHDPAFAEQGRSPSFRDVMGEDDRVLFIQTFSKNWAMTGWRIGWLETPPELGQIVENLVQYSTSGVPHFLQRGAVAALDEGEEFLADQIAKSRRGRAIVCEGLAATNVVDLPPPPAAFYAFFRVLGRPDTRALARDIVDDAAVGLAPGSAFGPGGGAHLRLCFLRDPLQLEEAVERLARVLPRLARAEAA
ncbi:pyridoxal phosphate-dependent aminotransferase [Enterovirga rhinocerotis]|uniref:8-amino-7-oxononanoate synthase n=1 Tax=Enterovirga rhinocerotis TaxID=1339210 RepID=A0A4R7BR38_9HYPH|nr:pyridoxal phosphate-dependent aminotransferase [Enterovirga rhinocerotis]TDR88140.1 aspartate/methionine/tyrosine aminotransferase [Enterovirga rhinocerotis]